VRGGGARAIIIVTHFNTQRRHACIERFRRRVIGLRFACEAARIRRSAAEKTQNFPRTIDMSLRVTRSRRRISMRPRGIDVVFHARVQSERFRSAFERFASHDVPRRRDARARGFRDVDPRRGEDGERDARAPQKTHNHPSDCLSFLQAQLRVHPNPESRASSTSEGAEKCVKEQGALFSTSLALQRLLQRIRRYRHRRAPTTTTIRQINRKYQRYRAQKSST